MSAHGSSSDAADTDSEQSPSARPSAGSLTTVLPIYPSPPSTAQLSPPSSTSNDTSDRKYTSIEDLPAVDVELPSITAPLGALDGLDCLDLACGHGRYSRYLLKCGAAKVIGLDASRERIELARESIASLPVDQQSRISFVVRDCSKPFVAEEAPFDLVFAGHFLNFAPDFASMVTMLRNVFDNLKPTGRFVAITTNPFTPLHDPFDDRYGIDIRGIEKVSGGWKTRLTASLEPPAIWEAYHYLHLFYENAAAKAGLKKVKWHSQVLPDDERKGTDFWDVLIARPQICVLSAIKPVPLSPKEAEEEEERRKIRLKKVTKFMALSMA